MKIKQSLIGVGLGIAALLLSGVRRQQQSAGRGQLAPAITIGFGKRCSRCAGRRRFG